MPGKIPNEERLTEDEIARRKLGPRGVPGGENSTKMTPQQRKNLPKEGEFDGHVAYAQVRPGQGTAQLRVSLAERVSILKDVVLKFANRKCFCRSRIETCRGHHCRWTVAD